MGAVTPTSHQIIQAFFIRSLAVVTLVTQDLDVRVLKQRQSFQKCHVTRTRRG